ncbi:hypothetical protein CXG81DRAFT_25524 [Caulochytrium protostelioides]|uniref:RRM domain-containing protein n=1 Tax=Caulochytrium protostelioides TaxID=1555241 RepID=A0A4P9X9R1_9FUNG|nr:hypothetical protein CXG81DRAFT_25524 [Caulochytrium protostelioides]|eukprot:RKP01820.1 hypothetical protein CXG81DRAFT_25524 [Caulochytrium protostelioides]
MADAAAAPAPAPAPSSVEATSTPTPPSATTVKTAMATSASNNSAVGDGPLADPAAARAPSALALAPPASLARADGRADAAPAVPAGKLFIGFGSSLSEHQLLAAFTPFGPIADLHYPFHRSGPHMGAPCGYAFLTYERPADAAAAMAALNGRRVRGSVLTVGPPQTPAGDAGPASHGGGSGHGGSRDAMRGPRDGHGRHHGSRGDDDAAADAADAAAPSRFSAIVPRPVVDAAHKHASAGTGGAGDRAGGKAPSAAAAAISGSRLRDQIQKLQQALAGRSTPPPRGPVPDATRSTPSASPAGGRGGRYGGREGAASRPHDARDGRSERRHRPY